MATFCYGDVETGGLDEKKSPLLQISLAIEINGIVVEKFNKFIKPFPNDLPFTPESIDKHGFTEEEVRTNPKFEDAKEVYNQLIQLLDKYTDKYNKKDKMFFIGYNCNNFDISFIRAFFEKNNNNYFGSYFWWPGIDVMAIYADKLIDNRLDLPNFQLHTVAKHMGINVNPEKLHDGLYDVQITRELFIWHKISQGFNIWQIKKKDITKD
jgi:DNA polymerase-3 subunit epsilon